MSPNSTVPLSEAMQARIGNTDSRLPIVLIVDDEKIIADTLSAIFNNSGFVAFAAYDAQSALDLAALVPPELLITDVVMPGMSGIDLAIAIETILPNCRILLFSGQASTVDLLEKARTLGHDFTTLTKPVHPTELLKRASDYLHLDRSPQGTMSSMKL